jgi:hypothetical protein
MSKQASDLKKIPPPKLPYNAVKLVFPPQLIFLGSSGFSGLRSGAVVERSNHAFC